MALDTVSILDGNTFVVSDRRGDLDATPIDNHGLFLNDTRFLSRWLLTVDGHRPTLLSIDEQAYSRVQFFLALTTGTVYVDSHLSVVRRRAITAAAGFTEEIDIVNHDNKPVDLEVKLEVDADFADLFEVKDKLDKRRRRASSTATSRTAAFDSATGARLTSARPSSRRPRQRDRRGRTVVHRPPRAAGAVDHEPRRHRGGGAHGAQPLERQPGAQTRRGRASRTWSRRRRG